MAESEGDVTSDTPEKEVKVLAANLFDELDLRSFNRQYQSGKPPKGA